MSESAEGDRSDQLAVAILKRGYKRAADDGLISVSPIQSVKAPTVTMRPQHILNQKEVIRFLRVVKAQRPEWFPLMYCAISLGMRESELFGLLWSRVDLDQGRVKVIEQAGELTDGTLGQVPLKTKASKRTLYLDRYTVAALRLQEGKDDTLVFVNPRSQGYLLKRTMSATVFPSLVKAAGLPTDGTLWFHLLRHAASSMLSAANLSTPKIDKWMGHSVSGIAGKYIQIHDEEMAEVSRVMERLLKPVWDTKVG